MILQFLSLCKASLLSTGSLFFSLPRYRLSQKLVTLQMHGLCSCSLPPSSHFPPFIQIHLDQNYGRIGKQAVGKTGVQLRVKNNVLIRCQASWPRSNPQTFISLPWTISGGIRGPKETKSWWIELISPPMMDGPVHRGLENGSIVHLSLWLPWPSMICACVVKATSGLKDLPPSLLTPLTAFFPEEFPAFQLVTPPQATLMAT